MTNSSEEHKRRPSERKLISAALIGILLTAAITVIIVRASHGGPVSAGPAKQSTARSSTCGLKDGAQSIPQQAPPSKWRLIGKFAAPSSTSFGPAASSDGVHTCFAHSPTGALFAAANYLADSANPKISKSTLVEHRLYKDRDSKSSGSSEGDTSAKRPTLQVSGFRIEDATKNRTSVVIVVRSAEGPAAGQNYALTLTLGWQSGDWRIVVPDGGQPPTSAISSLSGYAAWSGA